jgi:hypothetical protein
MSTVRTFRLINGDVLIAETDDTKPEDATSIYVTNPAIIFLKSVIDQQHKKYCYMQKI